MTYAYSRTRWTAIILPLLLAILAAACAGFNPQQFVPVISDQPATPTSEPTATPALSLETPALMCTPPACAPGEGYGCPSGDCPGGCGTVCVAPTPITGPLAAAPTDWEGLEGWLAALWRSDMDPAAVRAALQQSGMQRSQDDWRAADFNGDLQDEWVLVLYDQSMPGVPFGAPGDLWIVNGDGVIFRYYNAPSNDIYSFLAPRVVEVVDLTGDGLPELITDTVICGAHTCTDNFRIVGVADGEMSDRVIFQPLPEEGFDGSIIPMNYAETQLEDFDGDGLLEFLVHGGTLGSAGAGVVRPRTEVWGWNGADVVLEQTLLDPAAYRHHVLYEANDRMAAGDLDGALALYETAINDPALRDDGYLYAPEQARADVSAFAAFRLILIDLLQGNAERANSRLAWLTATYPASAAAGAAATLVSEWAGPENGDALCDRIEAGLLAAENPLGALADMGYGNPGLGEGDYCPDMHAWE
jgi:hypothetical protein